MSQRELTVGDLMTRGPATVRRDDRLSTADDVMQLGRVRHMPVVDDDGALVGIVSQRDLFHNALLRALGYGTHGRHKLLEMYLVKDAMHTDVITTTAATPLHEAAAMMREHAIGCLPVLEDGSLTGILSESDFVKLAVPR